MTGSWTYYALYPRDPQAPPVGLLAEGSLAPERRLVAIGWSHRHRTWTEATASLGAMTVNPDYEDRLRIVDRETAERIARESLGAELPTEEEMQRIGEGPSMTYRKPTPGA